tara:strand:- start:5715 stop:6392 length:678 start_codon:yes stop_codon:yes gene_type:complete
MANTILIIGKSGTGKTTSLRNLPPEKTLIISPNAKALPWKGSAEQYQLGKNMVRVSSLIDVPNLIKQAADGSKFNYVVVDDTTHLQTARMLEDQFIASKDWGKWNRFGSDVAKMMTKGMETYREDLTVIFIGHTDTKEDGTVGMRTSGKLLDNTIDIPSYFTYLFHSLAIKKDGGKIDYVFQTNDDGAHLAKTPMGMFDELYVENDLVKVIDTIHEYTGLKKTNV